MGWHCGKSGPVGETSDASKKFKTCNIGSKYLAQFTKNNAGTWSGPEPEDFLSFNNAASNSSPVIWISFTIVGGGIQNWWKNGAR